MPAHAPCPIRQGDDFTLGVTFVLCGAAKTNVPERLLEAFTLSPVFLWWYDPLNGANLGMFVVFSLRRLPRCIFHLPFSPAPTTSKRQDILLGK